MIPYLGCAAARGMLDAFVDAELPVDQQVALDAHLRWCETCRARVDDLRLIGAALRLGSVASALRPDEAAALSVVHAEVLARVEAERDQSLAVRARELFADNRLLWPALGATLALVACLYAVTAVYSVARTERPDSMAALISALADPRADHSQRDAGVPLAAPPPLTEPPAGVAPEGEAVFLLSAVVTAGGRVATYELLRSAREPSVAMSALVDALRYSQLAPGQTADGSVVNVVWLLARTTVKASAEPAEPADQPLSADPAPPVLRPARS